MLKFIILSTVLAIVTAGKSPHGDEYFAKLKPEDLRAIPDDVIEDSLLDAPGLIEKYGYPVESHEVETEDGYLLSVYRIPGGRHGTAEEGRIPVFLMHGLTGTSADWILNKPERGLAYLLADAGYDVWLGNARGNYYSRKHVSLDPEGRRFWMFSWHQIGFYDLPAMIDYALAKNGKDKLHYVGHSQGTTSFFVMGSTRPEYNDKIITMNALAPVAYMANVRSNFIKTLSKYGDTLQILFTLLGRNEFLPKTDFMREVAAEHCHEEAENFEFCVNFFYGENYEYVNITMIPAYLSHYPAGASTRQLVHYAQLHLSGKFREYDRGSFGNIAFYNSLVPPRYKLRELVAPVALHYSDSDGTVDPKDVETLLSELGNPIGKFKVSRTSFNHLDYIVALDVQEQVYDTVMRIMKEHE